MEGREGVLRKQLEDSGKFSETNGMRFVSYWEKFDKFKGQEDMVNERNELGIQSRKDEGLI